jgi:F0F1-type ATP synthase assembly protein I
MPSGSEFAGIGLQFGLTIVVFVLGGVWLDNRLHTSPWFVIGCTFAGAAGGFYSMYRRVMAAQRRNDRDNG